MSIYLGVDLGTSGLRVTAVDENGRIQARVRTGLKGAKVEGLPAQYREQRVESWTSALQYALREAVTHLPKEDIKAIACDGTSGTLALLDADGAPLRPAILYDDSRAVQEAGELNQLSPQELSHQGYEFGASYALPKALWLMRHEPEAVEKARYFAQSTDVLNRYLIGDLPATDTSSAMKMGADLYEPRWLQLVRTAGIPPHLLPDLVFPGTPIGVVSASVAGDLGLPPETLIVSGATDGTAGTLAAGVSQPGDWCGTLGTTLVVRGLSDNPIRDPDGRFYNHRHPDGMWMPGGASNTGGIALDEAFPATSIPKLVQSSSPMTPAPVLCYPLPGTGERFPFNAPKARGFRSAEPGSPAERAASILQSLAFLERYALDLAKTLGAPVNHIYRLAGRTAGVMEWAQLRANALGRPVLPLPEAESGLGAAILAAAGAEGVSIAEASRKLAPKAGVLEPDPHLAARFDPIYDRFIEECRERFSLA